MSSSAQPRQYLNPQSGSVVEVEAGSSVDLVLELTNEAPNPQGFYLEAEGLPSEDWGRGFGSAGTVVLAALGAGALRASLCPPLRGAPGDYPVTLRVIADGAPLDPPGDVKITLRVQPGPEPPEPAPEPEEAVAAPPGGLKPVAGTPAAEEVVDEPAAPAATEPSYAEAAQGPASVPPVAQATEPPSAAEPRPAASAPSEAPRTPPTAAPPPSAPKQPVAQPRPARPAPTQKPAPPKAPPKPHEEPLPVVDLEARPTEAELEEEETPEVAERSMLDPREGTVVSLKPGETMLLRFGFRNERRTTTTYVIDEDRSLEPGWLTLVQDQVNINANGTGEVSVRLNPPLAAAPGSYPFVVRVGPLGETLTPCSLVLEVQPTPAVKLTTKQAFVKAGPFARSVDFSLTVESAGNADTSFRIAVKDPSVELDEQGRPKTNDDLYETPEWRYLFDKEFDTLESKALGRAPAPVPVQLRMLRKGVWWFGFKELHRARVRAVPVTDPGNGGKEVNTLDLTGQRWRLVPIPGFLAWPLALILFVLLASGASNVSVTNAYNVGTSYYVLQMRDDNWTEGKPVVPMTAKVRWSAPWYALLRLKITEENQTEQHYFVHGGYDDRIQVEEYGDRRRRSYEVGSLLRPGADPIQVRFVPLRTDMKLLITAGPRARAVEEFEKDEVIGGDRIPLKTREVFIDVPVSGSERVNFSNLTDERRGLKVILWPVSAPTQFRVENFNLTDSSQIPPGSTLTAKVTFTGTLPADGPPPEEDWQFVTTDATHQILHVRLRAKVD